MGYAFLGWLFVLNGVLWFAVVDGLVCLGGLSGLCFVNSIAFTIWFGLFVWLVCLRLLSL